MKKTATRRTSAFTGIILLITILAALVIIIIGGCAKGKIVPEEKGREIAALVNGARVYFDEVNEFYSYQMPSQQAIMSKADALSSVIEREILYQEAVKRGFKAADEEVKQEFKNFLSANNLTEPALEKRLAIKNSSVERLKSVVKKRIMINRLLDSKVQRQSIIKHEEAEAFYNANNLAVSNITFDQAEKTIVGILSAQRQEAALNMYVTALKEKADVLIIAVPS